MKSMEPALRPFQPADSEGVRRLMQQIWGEDNEALSYYQFGDGRIFNKRPALFTIVAESGGRIVGSASAWKNDFHPNAYYFGVHVHPAFQQHGTGRKLFDAITELNTLGLPLQTSLWDSSLRGIKLLQEAGFVETRRTWMPLLAVQDVEDTLYGDVEGQVTQAGYRLLTLGEYVRESGRSLDIAALCREIYTATHDFNPPAELTSEEWERIVMADALLEGSMVALYNHEPVAIALLHDHARERTFELGWRGVTAAHRQSDWLLMVAMSLRQVQYGRACGVTYLRAEIDSTDPWARLILENFPFSAAATWVTYHRAAQ